MSSKKPELRQYDNLFSVISQLLSKAKNNIVKTINNTMIVTYWHIGQFIVEYEQGGKDRAVYGTQLLKRLSADLTSRFGKGYSWRNLYYMKQFYIEFPILQTVFAKSEKEGLNFFSEKLMTLL